MKKLREHFARLTGVLSRRLGRGGGTTLPGRVLLGLEPGVLKRLGSGLEHGSVLVSGTNGKTTTSSMLTGIVRDSGEPIIANSAGSNMPWGIVTALIEGKGKMGLFEVDEAWLPEVAESLSPRVILLNNLFRDQLDRYGETETIAQRWSEMASDSTATFAVNADDPLVSAVGDSAAHGKVYFGVEDRSLGLDQPEHARDAKHCRSCGQPLDFEVSFIGHLGIWSCPACGSSRPQPQVSASEVELHGMEGISALVTAPGGTARLRLPIPGLYNLYNALGAIAAAHALGIELDVAVRSLGTIRAVFGRVERVRFDGKEAAIVLIKNPVGANEVLRTLAVDERRMSLWIALNDRIADGRDVSWIWDADFERLAGHVDQVVCSGTRASEMALRLKYAGFPTGSVLVDDSIGSSFDSILERTDGDLFALPTYTALLELKDHLSSSKGLGNFWENGVGSSDRVHGG